MTNAEEREMLLLVRENNILLKQIVSYIQQKESGSPIKDFMINYIANKAADTF